MTAAKHAKCLCHVLLEIGYPQDGPTPPYEDNMSVMNMIHNCVPTEQSWHSDIQHSAIQDWVHARDIVMRHITGILSLFPMDLPKLLVGSYTPAMLDI